MAKGELFLIVVGGDIDGGPVRTLGVFLFLVAALIAVPPFFALRWLVRQIDVRRTS